MYVSEAKNLINFSQDIQHIPRCLASICWKSHLRALQRNKQKQKSPAACSILAISKEKQNLLASKMPRRNVRKHLVVTSLTA